MELNNMLKNKIIRNLLTVLIFAAIAAGLVARFTLFSMSFEYDELFTAVTTDPSLSLGWIWVNWLVPDVHPPLYKAAQCVVWGGGRSVRVVLFPQAVWQNGAADFCGAFGVPPIYDSIFPAGARLCVDFVALCTVNLLVFNYVAANLASERNYPPAVGAIRRIVPGAGLEPLFRHVVGGDFLWIAAVAGSAV